MSERAALIYERAHERLRAVTDAVPPLNPPAPYWLDSDGGPTYCRPCAIIARGREFELGPLLRESDWFQRDEWENAFFEGIDGGFSGEADHPESCEICGKTLAYSLTDYGFRDEAAHYLENPLVTVRDEDSYAIDVLFGNVWAEAERKPLLAAVAVVNQAYRLVIAGKVS